MGADQLAGSGRVELRAGGRNRRDVASALIPGDMSESWVVSASKLLVVPLCEYCPWIAHGP